MSDSNSDALKRAYELVEAGQPEEARSILDALLVTDPRNPDAWWIYAYAVDDPAEAQRALKTVLQLDPDYPEAAELLQSLQEQYPQLAEAESAAALAEGDAPPLPTELPDVPDEQVLDLDEEPEFLPPPATAIPEPPTMRVKREKRNNLPIWIALVAAIALILVILLLLRPGEPSVTTAGLATATAPSGVDETTGAQVTLEVSPLSAGETEEAGLETALPDGALVTQDVQPTVASENTVVLQVTPLDAATAEQTAQTDGTVATPDQGAQPTADTGTTGQLATLSVETSGNVQATPVGTTAILEVTPLDANSGEQAGDTVTPDAGATETTEIGEEVATEQAVETGTTGAETETVPAPTTESGAAGELGVMPTESAGTAEVSDEATTEPGEALGTEVAVIPTLEGEATMEAGDPGTEIALLPTTESGTSGETGSEETETPPAAATVEDAGAEATSAPDATTEVSSGTDVTPTAEAETEVATSNEATPTSESFVVEATLAESTVETGSTEVTEPAPTAAPGQETGGEVSGLQGLEQSLTSAGFSNYAITGLVTNLGNALIVSICAEEGPELREVLAPAMGVVASSAASQDVRFTVVGVEVLSCANPRQTLRLIVVERPIAENYASGNLTEEEFQSTWISL